MLKLSAKIRSENENLSKVREDGFVPGIIYGYNTENIMIKTNFKELKKIYKEAGESTLLKITLMDENDQKIKKAPIVLVQEIQEDPIKDQFIHIDFYQPNLKEKVEVEIPLEFVGESPLIKTEDGTLVKNYSAVEIKALPEDLIHSLEVDITVLQDFDDVIKIKDLKVPQGTEIIEDPESIVALIARPRDVEEELEEPIEEGVEEVEVIGEKEKEDEEEKEEDEESEKTETEVTKNE